MRLIIILFIYLSFISGETYAVTPEKNPQESPTLINKIVNAPVKLVDSTQGYVDENVTKVANRLDSFFGTERADDELNRSQVRILYNYRISEGAPKDDFRFRINLRLQNLEDFGKENLDKVKDWASKKTSTQNTESGENKTEQQKRDDPHRWLFRQDIGVIASVPPRFFYRTRLRKTWQGPHMVHRFVEELGWSSADHWLDRTTFESDRALSESVLFRLFHEKNWAITDREFTTSHGPSIIHRISDSDAFSYNARALSRIKGPWYLDGYSLSIAYRRRLRGNWLYGDVTPALDFPKAASFRRTPSILFRVEILFGGVREDITSTSQNTL